MNLLELKYTRKVFCVEILPIIDAPGKAFTGCKKEQRS